MGHAKRKEDRRAFLLDTLRSVDEREALDDTAVDEILDVQPVAEDGDPIAGIFNAFVASLGLWLALGVVWVYLA